MKEKRMSFTKLNAQTEALEIKKGTVVVAYLNGCRIIPAKKKDEKNMVILLMTDKKTKSPIEVWANGVMKYQLLNEKGDGLKPELRGVLFRFTGGNTKKIPGRQSPMREVDIEMDANDTIKGGKDYFLKPAKSAKKVTLPKSRGKVK